LRRRGGEGEEEKVFIFVIKTTVHKVRIIADIKFKHKFIFTLMGFK